VRDVVYAGAIVDDRACWHELEGTSSTGAWFMQFHAGPSGHAFVRDPEDPTCHRFSPCRFGENEATYKTRVKSDVAQGLGAMRSAFDLPAGWQGATFAVPWDDAAQSKTTTEERRQAGRNADGGGRCGPAHWPARSVDRSRFSPPFSRAR
jgi:hypothetical protein